MNLIKLGRMILLACILLMMLTGYRIHAASPAAGKTVVFLVNEDEYQAAQTVPEFARMLGEKYGFKCEALVNTADAKDPRRFALPDMEKVKSADLVVVYMRRRALPEAQMKILRDYLASGKPLVGIRTASHAFDAKFVEPGEAAPAAKGAQKLPEGLAQWKSFDKDVLGCNYHNHYGKEAGKTGVTVVPEKKSHPILTGVPASFDSPSWLYLVQPLAPTAEALMMGKIAGKDAEPVLITNTTKQGGRVVYTTLGHQDDFKIPAFERLLVNSIFWTLKLDVPKD